MKKLRIQVIATILIIVHLIVFVMVLWPKNEVDIPKSSPAQAQPTTAQQEPNPPKKKFSLPNLFDGGDDKKNEAPEAPMPNPVPTPSPVPTVKKTNFAVPGSTVGYLRSDLPVRRPPEVYSKLINSPYQGAIIVDTHTGKILFEDRATSFAYPASITKLMTMLLVLEQIEAGKISLQDKVAINKEVSEVGGSQAWLDPRESKEFTVHNMLQALLIHSANDAARALALHVAGSQKTFVKMMNERAKQLGMNATHYFSENGLPPKGSELPDTSTAHDIAILSLEALRHEKTLEYTSTKLAFLPLTSVRKEKLMLANRNALVSSDPYPGCDGLKTGYHGRGGWSIAATAEKDGKRIIAVLLGAPSKNERNDTMKKLLDKGFKALK